jgi:hypothetical protein
MLSPISDDYLTNYDWFRAYVEAEDQPVILCHTSALECLELFPGYGNEKEIDVFAARKGKFDNVNYHIIDDLSQKETVQFGSLTCTTVSQTANDMLDDYDNMDIQAFVEGLADYYYSNGQSWDKLFIEPHNAELFEFYREGAEDHFRSH